MAWIVALLAGCILLALAGLVFYNPYPRDNSPEKVLYHGPTGRKLQPGQPIKVMTYNIQFLAGKRYVFFFDLPDWNGPDTKVRPEDVLSTAREIARLVRQEDPDFLLLQEVDDGSKRTGYRDQLRLLLDHLPQAFCCSTSTFYWRVRFVPHPRIWGSIGIKLSILSKYRMSKSIRYNLPMLPANPALQSLGARRAILQAFIPVEGQSDLIIMNTHLEAFVAGTDVMQQQVERVHRLLQASSGQGNPWVIGGDFNLLPEGQYESLPPDQKAYYNPATEITPLYENYNVIPSRGDLKSANHKDWFTYSGNDPSLKGPDRTLDYLIHSGRLATLTSQVRMEGTAHLSDHFPVIATFRMPGAP